MFNGSEGLNLPIRVGLAALNPKPCWQKGHVLKQQAICIRVQIHGAQYSSNNAFCTFTYKLEDFVAIGCWRSCHVAGGFNDIDEVSVAGQVLSIDSTESHGFDLKQGSSIGFAEKSTRCLLRRVLLMMALTSPLPVLCISMMSPL
jgi:hypothetical protein